MGLIRAITFLTTNDSEESFVSSAYGDVFHVFFNRRAFISAASPSISAAGVWALIFRHVYEQRQLTNAYLVHKTEQDDF